MHYFKSNKFVVGCEVFLVDCELGLISIESSCLHAIPVADYGNMEDVRNRRLVVAEDKADSHTAGCW
jgi:hypothetical protein